MNRNRAWLYCQVRDSGSGGDTFSTQARQLEQYALELGFEIVGSSGDVGSAPGAKRPGLRELHEAMDQGNLDALVLESLSCLGRDSEEILWNWAALRKNGVRLCTRAEGEVYLNMRTLLLELFGANENRDKG